MSEARKLPRWARKALLKKKVKEIMDSQDRPHNEARERLAAEKAAMAAQPPMPPFGSMRVTQEQATMMILQRLSLIEVMVGRTHDALMHIIQTAQEERASQAEPQEQVAAPAPEGKIPVEST